MNFWRNRISQMSAEPERDGYQSYAHGVDHYFVRQDSNGRVTRLVVCRRNNENFCSHHTLLGNYWFRYDAPLAEADALDPKLASLVESWRLK